MKVLNLLLGCSALLLSCSKQPQLIGESADGQMSAQSTNAMALAAAVPTWKLIFSDEFNASGNFDANKWSFSNRGTAAWTKYLTSAPAYASQNGTDMVLRMDNAVIAGDNVPYHSGGIQTATKFNFRYGKVEVRAKFNQGQGSWPAIWMMPETASYGGWPNSGEIDIMEHVNFENVVHQSVHNGSVTGPGGGTSATSQTAYNTADYNIYGIEWTPTEIKFFVNNVLRYTYSKAANATSAQWPFDKPFYIILNQSGGAGWPGAINNAHLPFNMMVDWVRVYKQEELLNNSFESGALAPWVGWNPAGGGVASVVSSDARTGTKAIREQGGETSIEQVITGLVPNTTYIYGGYGKVAASGQSVSLGVKNYGGTTIASQITSTAYQHASVTFTTGASSTSATVYFYKQNAGTAFGDDFYLHKQ